MAAKLARLFVTTFQSSITNPPCRLGLSGPDALSHIHCRASARLGVSASGSTRTNDSMGYGLGPDPPTSRNGYVAGARPPQRGAIAAWNYASEAKGQSGCREEC